MCLLIGDIGTILRDLFKEKYEEKFKKDCRTSREKFKKEDLQYDQDLLLSGNRMEWDITLLGHALLYSSQFLLAERIGPVRLQPTIFLTSPSIATNDIIFLHDKGHVILKKVYHDKKTNRVCVSYKTDELPRGTKADVYKCTEEWFLVKDLVQIRNDYAHLTNPSIELPKLKDIVHEVKKICLGLLGEEQMDKKLKFESGIMAIYLFHSF